MLRYKLTSPPSMPERSGEFHNSGSKRSERDTAVRQTLANEHEILNDEWSVLAAEEGQLIADGATSPDRLRQIHGRQTAITNRLWEIERRLADLHREERPSG
jgi:hypothetical protein